VTEPLKAVSIGEGPAVVILQGFAMRPATYLPLARLLADRVQVVIPALFELPGRWSYTKARLGLEATLDHYGLEAVTLIGHSFGGALELGLAAEQPSRVVECVFSDTLALKQGFGLAAEALRHAWLLGRMASRASVSAFAISTMTHPFQLAEAGLWAFGSDRSSDMTEVVRADIPCHVLWASRDTLLARSDGQAFAQRLGADFHVAQGAVVDHDWMFDSPELFADHLMKLGLVAFNPKPDRA
jgi:pimeloyl-ACP methyl ester carboxylesterase